MRVPMHYLYDPFDSKVTNFRIEPGTHCDGKRCGLYDEEEAALEAAEGVIPAPVPPHFHLIIWGEQPRTAFRCMPFADDLPIEMLEMLRSSE
jgi:hypothetical protein